MMHAFNEYVFQGVTERAMANVVQKGRHHQRIRRAAVMREVSRLQSVLAHAYALAEVRLCAAAGIELHDVVCRTHAASHSSSCRRRTAVSL